MKNGVLKGIVEDSRLDSRRIWLDLDARKIFTSLEMHVLRRLQKLNS
jgi:hypothetical protein